MVGNEGHNTVAGPGEAGLLGELRRGELAVKRRIAGRRGFANSSWCMGGWVFSSVEFARQNTNSGKCVDLSS